jgi:hypothetical protein
MAKFKTGFKTSCLILLTFAAVIQPVLAKDSAHCEPTVPSAPINDASIVKQLAEFLNSERGPLAVKTLASWNNPKATASILSESEVAELFSKMAKVPEIPFEYPEDGCYARATYMSYLMEKAGIHSVRVYVVRRQQKKESGAN